MVNYSHILRTRWFSGSVFIAFLLLMTLSYTHAQPCSVLDGDTRDFIFTSSSADIFFPATLPAGKTGSAHSTAGRLRTDDPMTAAYPLRTVTINPEFTDGTVGSVVLRFDLLTMAAPGAVIRIYPGTLATGTPAEVINNTNAASYLLQTRTYVGPVTVTFVSPTPAASGDFDIRITYTTGDQVVTSPFGFQVAYWTNFITPNSYVALENYPDWAVPIATAYFNESKQLVSSEISFCTDYGQDAPSVGNSHFPGQFVFHPTVRTDYDENGTVEPIDKLIAARIVYILSHAPQPISNFDNFIEVQSAIDATNSDPNGNYGGLFGQAKAAIPSLNSPVEPVFSITGPSSGVAAGVAQNFVVNLTNDGGYSRVYTLEIPAGITVNSVTGSGVTYNAVNKTITFASAPASATVSVTSAVSAVAAVRVVYNQPGFWNVNNLLVYEPCDSYPKATYQGFLGISKGSNPYPFREASGTWQSTDLDYGDLPNSYNTALASNGPSHVITAYNATAHTASLMLGSQIDPEADGVAGTLATGDNLAEVNDEDAITKFPVLVPGSTSYSVTLAVTNTTGANATVKGWIDFNKDGAFGAGEEATQTVSNGGTSVTLTWPSFPAVATFGYTYARFRIASVASEIASPTGLANSGEVEDYRLFIGRTVAGSVFNDVNRNTRIDTGEPFTSLPAPMYVYMVQNNIIVDAAAVAANGSYLLLAPSGQTSAVHLSALQYMIGTDVSTNPISHTPPTGWVTTGENGSGTNTGNGDFLPDGILSVTVTTANLTNRNFGITCNSAGTSGSYDICASETAVLPLAEFITGEDAGGTWTQLTGSGITFDAIAGTVQLTSTATTSTYRYDVPATANCAGSSSIATITVRPLPIKYQSVTICEGGSVCIFNPAGTARLVDPQTQICHTTSGVFTDTLLTAGQYGCDSIVVTTVTVVPTPNAGTDGSVAACNNSTTPIDLFSLITGEQTGGTWARLTGTGGTFDAVAGTYTPALGATNSTFSYTLTAAGSCGSDASIATVNLNICTVEISGSVLNDGNGLAGTPVNTVDGVAIQSASGTQLHANLFTSAGVFVATVPINASGNYNFTVTPNTDYQVTVSATPAAAGSTPASSVSLPVGWENTGENVGAGAGSDGVPNGILPVSIGTANVTNVNFGIDHEPNSNSVTHVLASQPAVGAEFALDGTDAPIMNGADPEDGTYSGDAGSVNNPKGVIITSLPTHGELWYYGFGAPVVVSATYVANGTLFPDPSLFSVILTGTGYTSTTFEYAYVDAAGVTDPTPASYTISWDTPLPVKLVSFVARLESSVAHLSWSTTEEVNSDYFEVQHSPDAKHWTVLDRVIALGESSVKKDYGYEHVSVNGGLNYYRLRMVDKDGAFAMSSIRSVRLDNSGQVSLYPNPATDRFLFKDLDLGTVKSVKILNIAGLTVWQNTDALSGQGIKINLADGLYLVCVEKTDGSRETLKLMVRK